MSAPDAPFRLAIVGAGLIAQSTHLPTALSLPDVEVSAIVDSVPSRASAIARSYGINPQIASGLDEIIGKIDGAIIATPNHTHRQLAVPLLEAGVHTLIEKPMATNVAEGQAILDAARNGSAKVAVGYYQRFLDAPRLLQKLVREGYFGRVTRFCHQFGTPGGWAALSSYTLSREAVGGGVLVVTGTHFLDRMLQMWGTPDDVELIDDSLGGPEAHCEGLIRYGKDVPHLEGLVRYSKCTSLPSGLVLATERGKVILRDGFSDEIVLIPGEREDIRLRLSAAPDPVFPRGLNAYQRMLWDFVDACRGNRPPEVDGHQGLDSLRLLERFYLNRRPLEENWSQVAI